MEDTYGSLSDNRRTNKLAVLSFCLDCGPINSRAVMGCIRWTAYCCYILTLSIYIDDIGINRELGIF